MLRFCTKCGSAGSLVLLGLWGGAACALALALALALAVAGMGGCGTVLDLDGIEYDVDGAAAGAGVLDGGLPDALVDASAPDGAEPEDAPVAEAIAPPPDGPFTLVQGAGLPQAIALDDTRVYWVELEGATATGSVQSILKDGGSPATLAANQASPLDIAVNGTNVYWSVNQAAPAAGASQCLAMVAAKDGGVPSCALSGAFGSIRMGLAGPYLVVLSQAGTNEYVGFATPDAGYANVETQGPALAMAATSQTLFLGNPNGFHVDDLALPSLGFGPLICGINCGNSPIVDMTVDATGLSLFWITQAAGLFTESTASTTSAGVELAELPSAPQRIARDASYVYVTATSSVLAVPIAPADAGLQVLTLAPGEDHPFGVAVDDEYVYWADADGTIRATRVPPPL